MRDMGLAILGQLRQPGAQSPAQAQLPLDLLRARGTAGGVLVERSALGGRQLAIDVGFEAFARDVGDRAHVACSGRASIRRRRARDRRDMTVLIGTSITAAI